MKSKAISFFVTGYFAGVICSAVFDISVSALWLGVLLFVASVVTLYFFGIKEIALVCIVCGVFAGVIRYKIVDKSEALVLFSDVLNTESTFRVVVEGEPTVRDSYARYVGVLSHDDIETDLRVLLYTEAFARYQHGEALMVTGTLSPIENFSDDFNWRAFLAKDEIYAQLFKPTIVSSKEFSGGTIRRLLFSIKRELLLSLGRVLPEPHSALAGGLVFGGKRSLSPALLDTFRTAGLIHIVVLSGYNITIVGVALMAVLSYISLKRRLTIAAISMIAFGLMVGGGPTVVRSVIMALLALLARALGRAYDASRGLVAALFIMSVIAPKSLLFDTGFQLSFIATAGLIYLVPIIEPYLIKIPTVGGLREILATTISAQIAVLPLLVYAIGELSLVSLPVNILVLPVIPITMLFGVLTAVFGLLGRWLALLCGAITYMLLSYIFSVVAISVSVPHASVVTPQISGAMVIGIYLLGSAYIYLKYQRQDRIVE